MQLLLAFVKICSLCIFVHKKEKMYSFHVEFVLVPVLQKAWKMYETQVHKQNVYLRGSLL